ncbi:MAG: TonB-dependent receptor domain-containing protein, partial [Candidatus Acidiferrales bacterium]
YGRASGGVFNAVTRSGTNAFHGSAYEFLRNSALDARNPFDASQIPPFRRNQFGGSIGGPIQKDHTFFFADYEGLRQSLGVTQEGNTLSPDTRNGLLNFATPAQFPTGCTANGVTGTINGNAYSQCAVTVDPAIAKFIAANFFPVMNGTLTGIGNTGIFTNAVQQLGIENFVTGKVDHTFSNGDTLSGTYLFDNNALDLPDLQNIKILETHLRRQFVDLQETHVFSSQVINSFRVGLNRNFANIQSTPTAVNPNASDPSFGAVPGLFAPTVSVPGMDKFTGGLDGPPHYMFAFNSYQVADDVFLTKGAHSIKFGVSIERLQDNDEDIPSADGVFTFKSMANFLTNQPSRFQGLIPGTVSERGIRESLVGIYIQDDWRIKSNLTLNLGLRYEFATVPTEVQNKLSNFYNITDSAPHIGSPLFANFTHRNFEPRLGFSWDPFSDGKTAVRGGFGIYDMEPLPYEFFLGTAQAAPFLERATTNNASGLKGSFPAGALQLLVGNPKTFTYEWIEGNAHRRYVTQWNLSIERQLSQNNSIMAAYVGSSGVHLPLHMDDSNMVIPTLTSAGYVWPNPIGSGAKINPNFGPMVTELMLSHSSYHGAMLQVTHTSKRYQIQGSYTWSRSIDNASGTFAGDAYSNGIPTLDWYAPNLDKGPSDFNITQNLIVSGTFNLPGIHSNSWATWVTNGWELGTIFKANTGVPFSATMGAGGDVLGQNNTDPWDWPNRVTGGDCSSLVNPGDTAHYVKTQCFTVPTAPNLAFYQTYCDPSVGTYPQCFNLRGNAGRNILLGPDLFNLD